MGEQFRFYRNFRYSDKNYVAISFEHYVPIAVAITRHHEGKEMIVILQSTNAASTVDVFRTLARRASGAPKISVTVRTFVIKSQRGEPKLLNSIVSPLQIAAARTGTGRTIMAVVGLVVTLALAGCDNQSIAANANAPVSRGTSFPAKDSHHLILGFDASGGVRAHLGQYAALGAQMAGDLVEGTDSLMLVRVDHHTTVFSDRSAPGSANEVLPTLLRELRTPPQRPGTFPVPFFQVAATKAGATGKSTTIVLFTDGDNDVPSLAAKRAIRAAAQRLARNPRVRAVVICGCEKENRAWLNAAFAPLGDRFHILAPTEMATGTLAGLLDAARR